jgi:hypothetical protein
MRERSNRCASPIRPKLRVNLRESAARYESVRYDRVDSDSIPTGLYPRFLNFSARPSRSVGGGRRPPVRVEILEVAPSKFIFGVKALCRSYPSDILLQGGLNERGGRWGVLAGLIPEPFSLHLMLQKTESFEIDSN